MNLTNFFEFLSPLPFSIRQPDPKHRWRLIVDQFSKFNRIPERRISVTYSDYSTHRNYSENFLSIWKSQLDSDSTLINTLAENPPVQWRAPESQWLLSQYGGTAIVNKLRKRFLFPVHKTRMRILFFLIQLLKLILNIWIFFWNKFRLFSNSKH